MSFKFKSIRLTPTHFTLDVIVAKENKKVIEEVAEFSSKRYGASKEYYLEEDETLGSLNYVCSIDSTEKSELKGKRQIIMRLTKLDPAVIVHEIVHVNYRLQSFCDIELTTEAQEWQAYFSEYLFEEIMRKENYQEI